MVFVYRSKVSLLCGIKTQLGFGNYVFLVREDGRPGTGLGNQGKLVKFTRENWKVLIECNFLSLWSHCNDFELIKKQLSSKAMWQAGARRK